ncbi:MAG: hypothetical protein LBR24_01845 [Methanobrevibacter sp.]|jgi:hypothetical protein|nr:hypothetical protein [Methanobrevibacter sp.]
MKSSTYLTIVIALVLLFGLALWTITQFSLIEPVGRLTVTKIGNPDMYPGHANAEVLSGYAAKTGSKCILVVHYGGDSNYRNFNEDDDPILAPNGVSVLELAFVDPSTYKTYVDWGEVLTTFIFGIPENRYRYKADGYYFNTLDEALDYIDRLAKDRGQVGPIPMFYHGTVRAGNPYFNPGCGFPLYTQIAWKEYGRLGAYYYVLKGLLWPYVSSKYYPYQISHLSDLQKLYNQNKLNYQ